MTFYDDDFCELDVLTDDEIDELNENLDRQDLELSIPDAAERNRYLTWKARFCPAKISSRSADGKQT